MVKVDYGAKHYENCPCYGCKVGITKPVLKPGKGVDTE